MSEAVPVHETDDDWFDQLRDAVVSGADAPDPPDPPKPPQPPAQPPGADEPTLVGLQDLEAMIVRVLRAELPALLQEQLAADRQALVEDVVREIRTMLFGK